MKRFFRMPYDDMMSCLEHLMTGARPRGVMVVMVLSITVTWFVYVPVHELLHAYGLIWTGGEVGTLNMKWYYGGEYLAKWFPFIESGSDYAGQLTDFDTKGSDWRYLACDFAPFMLTVLIGVPLLRFCTRKRRAVLSGPAVVLGLAPFYNLPGDYYEMASIMSTRALTTLGGGGHPPRFEGLRSDDIFTLIPDVLLRPAELGLEGGFFSTVFAMLVVFESMILSVVLVFVTYRLGDLVARVLVGPAPVFTAPASRTRSRSVTV